MNRSRSIIKAETRAAAARPRGVALVITLLMLSVITFLAVAFLVMTRRDTASTAATLDVTTAQSMSDVGLARAQAEIIARMMAQTDVFAFDYMSSSNYIAPGGYNRNEPKNFTDTNSVNYDYDTDGNVMKSTAGADWAQNIANLFFDPRPPVFVYTNTDPSKPATDFRYYVDLNRDGAFEGASYRSANRFDAPNSVASLPNISGQPGEPEYIGVLADPTHPHSRTNIFVGRYAYVVLPIGKTLDLNYIHNQSQRADNASPNNLDDFSRNQGVGSWELNLAAYLRDLNTNAYDNTTFIPTAERYQYNPPRNVSLNGFDGFGNVGYCFDDARNIATNRDFGAATFARYYGQNASFYFPQFLRDGIDEYGASPYTNLPEAVTVGTIGDSENRSGITTTPWPGSYRTNLFYDMQDIFDPRKTSVAFTNRLAVAGNLSRWTGNIAQSNALYDRYTFQRLLATIGTGSMPEYGTFVYTNGVIDFTNGNPELTNRTPPTLLLTKMNLNYDNSTNMALGPYSGMPTNPVPWSNPMKFFTNAADLLLRTQEFPVTNYVLGCLEYRHFGLSSMAQYYPIYSTTNASFRYTAQLHRMLQLAANLYDEGHNSNTFIAANVTTSGGPSNVLSRFPSVFRPLMVSSNSGLGYNVYIVGYELMTSTNIVQQYNNQKWKFLSGYTTNGGITTNDNVYGVPWVVGAVKGLPALNQICVDTAYVMTRKLQVTRPNLPGAQQPTGTNQIYEMAISNLFGLGAWNSYTTPFQRPVDVTASLQMSVTFTNNSTQYPWGTNITITSVTNGLQAEIATWPGWNIKGQRTDPGSMRAPLVGASNLFMSRLSANPLIFSDLAGPTGPRGFWDAGDQRRKAWDTNCYAVHGWTIKITNYVTYLLQDHQTHSILDFVNVGPFGYSTNIIEYLTNLQSGSLLVGGGPSTQPSYTLVWNTNGGTENPSQHIVSVGELNQLRIGSGALKISDWTSAANVQAGSIGSDTTQFANFLNGQDVGTNIMSCPFQPSVPIVIPMTWAANDPMVHYTVEDLTAPGLTISPYIYNPTSGADHPLTNTLGSLPLRYEPWPSKLPGGQGVVGRNVALKDPGITNSDSWQFPTNAYPSVGWIGRVHRGTPWQTVYLKNDPDAERNASQWLQHWVGDLSPGLQQPGASYPTNDWALMDLFTTAPNENAVHGLLSVNQTNTAPWHALLDGVIVLTNTPDSDTWGFPIDPTASCFVTNNNAVSYILNSPFGINNIRTNHPANLFHRVGDILQSPTLTTESPFYDLASVTGPPDPNTAPARDEVVERIPQQVGSLLKVGQPQFVIYSWGQSLRPAAVYNPLVGTANLFKIPTNYTITGEYLTRTVCHLDLSKSDRFGTNAHIQIDSFDILPAAQ